MDDDITQLRQSLRELSISLHDAIEAAFHSHKLAERAFAAAQGRKLDPLADAHIEDSKREMLTLLEKATRKLLG